MNEEKINIAVNILNNQIAKLTKELAFSQEFDNELQAKIDVLEKIKMLLSSSNCQKLHHAFPTNNKTPLVRHLLPIQMYYSISD